MKRDMDLIRQIVLAKQAADGPLTGLDGVAQEVFGEHVLLLKEAGLVDAAAQLVQHKVPRAIVFRLTWAGHDFAQSIAFDLTLVVASGRPRTSPPAVEPRAAPRAAAHAPRCGRHRSSDSPARVPTGR